MNLVALHGYAGAGKSTAAKSLVVCHGWKLISFADTLRSMLLALGVTPEELQAKNRPIAWLGGKTPRELMQTLGTEWGRDKVTENIWVESCRRRILADASIGNYPGIVLDDARFDNEAKMVRDLGGIVIKIHRPGIAVMAHRSEAGISPHLIDHTIANDTDDCGKKLQSGLISYLAARQEIAA